MRVITVDMGFIDLAVLGAAQEAPASNPVLAMPLEAGIVKGELNRKDVLQTAYWLDTQVNLS